MSDTVTEDTMLLAAGSVEIEAAAKQADRKPRISIVAYTGGIIRLVDWGDVVIDLAGLDVSGQVPLLADHDARVSGVVGHGDARIVDGQLIVSGILSGAGEAARQIMEMATGGFTFQASVGVEPVTYERVKRRETVKVNGRALSSPRGFVLVRQGRLREVSITPLAADADTSVAIAAAKGKKETMMDSEVQNVDEQTIRTDERNRLAEVDRLCAGFTNDAQVANLRQKAIAGELSVSDLSVAVLSRLRATRPNTKFGSTVTPEMPPRDILAAAALMLAGASAVAEKSFGAETCARATDLRARSALDLCRAAIATSVHPGVIPHGVNELIKAAFSTTDLPVALGAAADKLAAQVYRETPVTWRSWVAPRPVKNFRDHTGIRAYLTNGGYEKVTPGGEIKHAALAEETYTHHADTRGRMFVVDRQNIVNDDLGLIFDLVRELGREGARSVADLVYTTLIENPSSFFAGGHGNLLTGGTSNLSISAMSEAIATFRSRLDAAARVIDVAPAVLVVPPALEPVARMILRSTDLDRGGSDEDMLPVANPWEGVVNLEVESRLSAAAGGNDTAWYLFSDPIQVAAGILSLLDGRETPVVEEVELPGNVLGAGWRGYHDFGFDLTDYRAALRADGA